MKILKVKKGYTTNSSSSNEWVPGTDDGSEVIEENTQMPLLKIGEEIVVLPAQAPSPLPPLPPLEPTFSSAGKLGILTLIVFSLLLLPKIYTYFKKRIPK